MNRPTNYTKDQYLATWLSQFDQLQRIAPGDDTDAERVKRIRAELTEIVRREANALFGGKK